ncbi:unnamed protein product [Schistocephalus solidus]|uniref:Uncharacterized protein n=1 Tax=Schistocephalus solidus TaxID=70667 RepID=A0A183TSU1_SCHSO|nr:unnamed protein product [Schistocephalus solidus]
MEGSAGVFEVTGRQASITVEECYASHYRQAGDHNRVLLSSLSSLSSSYSSSSFSYSLSSPSSSSSYSS